jgi:hypothetical protein
VAYRGPDLFRTGTGWTESGLNIYLRVLDALDLFALAAAGNSLTLPIPYSFTSTEVVYGVTGSDVSG